MALVKAEVKVQEMTNVETDILLPFVEISGFFLALWQVWGLVI